LTDQSFGAELIGQVYEPDLRRCWPEKAQGRAGRSIMESPVMTLIILSCDWHRRRPAHYDRAGGGRCWRALWGDRGCRHTARIMGYTWTPWIFCALAIVELITDQLPTTPSRKYPCNSRRGSSRERCLVHVGSAAGLACCRPHNRHHWRSDRYTRWAAFRARLRLLSARTVPRR